MMHFKLNRIIFIEPVSYLIVSSGFFIMFKFIKTDLRLPRNLHTFSYVCAKISD